jgi:hypothetical protein
VINDAATRGTVPQEWPTTRPVTQTLDRAFLLDQNRLLLVTANEVCDRIGSGACFGYHEILLLNKSTYAGCPANEDKRKSGNVRFAYMQAQVRDILK